MHEKQSTLTMGPFLLSSLYCSAQNLRMTYISSAFALSGSYLYLMVKITWICLHAKETSQC